MAQRTKELAGNHNCFGCVASADRRATLIIGAVVGSNIHWQWTPIRSGSCLIAGNRREPARVPCTCSTMSRGRHVGGAADAFGERKAAVPATASSQSEETTPHRGAINTIGFSGAGKLIHINLPPFAKKKRRRPK